MNAQAADFREHLAKTTEMFCEAIPGCVTQCYAYMKALKTEGGASKQALFSLAVSAMSTGFSAATITYDFDTRVDLRKTEPTFFGMIPSGTRGMLVFGCMIANGALLLLARSTSTALLWLVGWKPLAVYYTADYGIFFLQKVIRRDVYMFQAPAGPAGVVFSFTMNAILKAVVDHTGLVQFRGGGVLGGAYWTSSMVRPIPPPSPLRRCPTSTKNLTHARADHHPCGDSRFRALLLREHE